MRGSPKTTFAQAQPTTATVGGPSPAASATAGNSGFDNGVLVALIFSVLVYLGWAFVETHQSVEDAIKPQNVKFNVRTMILISFTAALGLTIWKIVLAKLAFWNIPGAAHLLALFSAA